MTSGLVLFDEVGEQATFVPRVHFPRLLVNSSDGETLAFVGQPFRIGQVLSGQPLNLLRNCGGHKNGLMLLGHATQDATDVIAEANVEHSVHFIEHRHLDVVIRQLSTLVEIHHPSRGANENMGPFLQLVGLHFHALSAVDGHDFDGEITGQGLEVFGDLNGQFSSGTQHQARERAGVFSQPVQEWQAKGRGFSGARS